MKTRWPKDVPVVRPGDVGVGKMAHTDGSPCCAYGYFATSRPLGGCGFGDQMHVAIDAYRACAKALRLPVTTVVYINDNANAATRALLVNATAACLGFTEGQDPAAVALARRAGFGA